MQPETMHISEVKARLTTELRLLQSDKVSNGHATGVASIAREYLSAIQKQMNYGVQRIPELDPVSIEALPAATVALNGARSA